MSGVCNETPFGPRHDRTNKVACAPKEDQPGYPPSLISLPCPNGANLHPKVPSKCKAKTLLRLGKSG